MGICSFCLISIFGLLVVGMKTNTDTVEQSVAAGLARAVVADLWSGIGNTSASTRSPLYKIALPSGTTASAQPDKTLFFAEDGTLKANVNQARYRVDVSFGERPSASAPAPMSILVTWPASANPTAGQWPSRHVGNFQVLTALSLY